MRIQALLSAAILAWFYLFAEVRVCPAQSPIGVPAKPAIAQAHSKVPDVALDRSDLLVKSADGTLGVLQKNGQPYDGVKLSKYNSDIFSPQIVCTSDGTIHVAFVERQVITPYAYFVFHRSSSDQGRTWSEAKNLSESLANFSVGTCKIAVDSQNRVYVIWRTSLKENFPVLQTPAGNGQHNLVYKVLEQGKWSKVHYIHAPGSAETQDNGSISFNAFTDAAGKVQVVWNAIPDRFHPEKYMRISGDYKQHCNGVGAGMVFQETLDGNSEAKPQELFVANFREKPEEGPYGKYCDSLDAISGFADANGQLHFIAKVLGVDNLSDRNTHISLFENGKGKPVLKLPSTFGFNSNPPILLLDAAGKKHIIAGYEAGEYPSVQDSEIGSNNEPTVIMSAKPPKGTIKGFQAFQGPNGKMIVLIQTTDAGMNDRGDNWLTTSTGKGWSKLICITNNAGREKWWSKNTGVISGVAAGSRFGPGDGAAIVGPVGHINVVLINVESGSFGLSAGGVVYMSGGSSKPQLCFYHF